MLLSSKYTLLLKIYIPLIWALLSGLFLIASMIFDTGSIMDDFSIQVAYLLIYACFLALFYFTFFQLKRVEIKDKELYVSNYKATFKYSLDSIAEINENDYTLFKTIRIKLKDKGSFGQYLIFIPQNPNYQYFVEDNATDLDRILNQTT